MIKQSLKPRTLLLFLLLVLIVNKGSSTLSYLDSSVDKTTPPITKAADGSWTIMVYIVGSDLQTNMNAGLADIIEMWNVGSSDLVNVVVCTGGSKSEGWQTVQYSRVVKENLETWKDLGSVSMADPNVLNDFVNESVGYFPAEKYGLILWNHGSGINGYGVDELHGQMFSIPQLTQTLSYINQNLNIKFEILGFDACLMASIEVAARLQGIAKYLVASEELEPGTGWDYTPILQSLVSGSIQNGKELGMVIADGFLNQCKAYNQNGATLSVIDLDVIGEVVQALETFISSPTFDDSHEFFNIARNRSKSEAYGKSAKNPIASYDGIDLEDFVRLMKKSNPELTPEANQFLYTLSQAVVYNRYDKTKPNASGLNIFFPFDKLVDDNAVNKSMEMYEQLGFSPIYTSFLNKYVGRSSIDEEGPILTEEQVYQNGNQIQANCNSTDIDEAYIVLIDGTDISSGTVEILGIILPDEMYINQSGGLTINHEWTGEWIGINDEPAYISDIFVESYYDEYTGTEEELYIITIPAVLNDEDVILTYTIDADGYYELESILPEVEEGGIFQRRHIDVQPGDQFSLVYEGINVNTGEQFWTEGDVFEIDSEDDLELSISELYSGDYILGFLLTDFARNETFVLTPNVYSID